MGWNNYTTPSTPSPEQTLAIIPSGIVADPRCITDLNHCGKEIIRAIRPMYRHLKQSGTRLTHLVVGGPPCLAAVCDEYTTSAVDISAHQCVVTQYLDDTRETGDGYEIPSVRLNRPQIGALLAREGRLSEDSIDEFDVGDAVDRARITDTVIRKLKPERYHRAQRKAECKRLEHLLNDWFDREPTANHVLIVGDDRHSTQHLKDHTMGDGDWVKYPTSSNGLTRSVSLSGSADGCLSWNLASIFDPRHRKDVPYHELTTDEQSQAQRWIDEPTRRKLGYPLEAEYSTVEPETASVRPSTAASV
jgi:hypothetical protein